MSDAGQPAPEPDRVEGAPHPRATSVLYGQEAAEAAFLAASRAGRLHHAWLLSGPRGVGKATLAWRIARHLIAAEGAGTLDMDPAHPVFRRCLSLGEARLFLLRRGWDERGERLRTVIDVEETRKLRSFLQLSAMDAGWRAIIIDAADEMNPSAANALLKLLEEPPRRVAFLLVSHQAARLLPTIRSRCRELRCTPLAAPDLARALAAAGIEGASSALAELSGGSVGEAVRLAAEGGPAIYGEIAGLLASLPRLDRPALVALAESVAGRGAAGRYDLALRLVPLALARLARAGASGLLPPEAAPGEAATLARLAPGTPAARAWAETAQRLTARVTHARGVNLDPAQVMLDTFFEIETTAQRLLAAA
ncbi:MAG TPA: DNA polymerase III subunit delta' [Paracoccaceae bacterium]|nr:DNA polymerase III subunit delta' [Paracoccaceae bacterium]